MKQDGRTVIRDDENDRINIVRGLLCRIVQQERVGEGTTSNGEKGLSVGQISITACVNRVLRKKTGNRNLYRK